MKTLTKLALVSAMAMSSSAFALQTLGDEELSQATGQDGITISLSGGITADALVVHDKGGLGATNGITAGNTGDGAIVLGVYGTAGGANDFSITGGNIDLVIDADKNGTSPVLNIKVQLPAALTVNTGDIYVAGSGGIAAASASQYTNATKVLDNISFVLNNATMNIQLGNQPQGALIKLAGAITGGLTINNLNILQGANGIRLGSVSVRDVNGADWNLNANINAVANGLAISNLGSADVRISNVKLGATGASTLGDVALLGLALPTVTISGH